MFLLRIYRRRDDRLEDEGSPPKKERGGRHWEEIRKKKGEKPLAANLLFVRPKKSYLSSLGKSLSRDGRRGGWKLPASTYVTQAEKGLSTDTSLCLLPTG